MLLPATFHEPAQLWAIDPSLLLVHICGTIHHFIFVTLNYIAFRVSPVTENAFVWPKIAAPSDLLLDVVRLINVLTNLLTLEGHFYAAPCSFRDDKTRRNHFRLVSSREMTSRSQVCTNARCHISISALTKTAMSYCENNEQINYSLIFSRQKHVEISSFVTVTFSGKATGHLDGSTPHAFGNNRSICAKTQEKLGVTTLEG